MPWNTPSVISVRPAGYVLEAEVNG
jgi:hypothetical protein